MRILTFSIVCACALSLPAWSQSITAWSLVWSDEFNQPDGASPDPTKWTFDLGGNGWGNNELESYTSRTNNCRIENSRLVIEARAESYTGNDGIHRDYTSARLKTKGRSSWTYGRIEARIQIPRGQGIWPAFWMLGTNIDSVSWPNCGEIDLMENIGAEPSTVHGTIHGPGYSGGNGIGAAYTLPGSAKFADAFHVFTTEWQTNRIRWYVDGQLYFTVTPANLPGGASWVFSQPQFLLLNVAVGGYWPGNPDGTTTFPQQMLVDYVRVYAGTNVPACTNDVPLAVSAARNGTGFDISFPTFLGLPYQVRYCDDLDGMWQVLTNLTGDGTTRTVAADLDAEQRFYRAVRLCN